MNGTRRTRSLQDVPRSSIGAGLILFFVFVFQGCGILDTTDRGAERAMVSITGDSPVPLELLTSEAWLIFTDPETFEEEVQILLADTAILTALPFNQDYPIADFDRFLIRLTNPDSTVASVRMTVSVDGSVEYDQQATMSQGGSLEFRFQINQFR